ncbi:hypothetical protein J6TS2_31610 [Heyndrickxia sporothermodurans]|nr:hypothetical protein J6TS2_31610 [Heyndrickxia sporothermodurans]
MEKIDFSPFKGQINHMAFRLAIIIFVPLAVGLIVKWILAKIKLPNYIASIISILILLFVFFKMNGIILG